MQNLKNKLNKTEKKTITNINTPQKQQQQHKNNCNKTATDSQKQNKLVVAKEDRSEDLSEIN